MENEVKDNKMGRYQDHNHRFGGLVLILVGVFILLHKIPETRSLFPHWMFTWPMILIVVGLYTGLKHKFRHPSWIILIFLGTFFLLTDNDILTINLRPYLAPLIIILSGVFVILKKNRRCGGRHERRFRHYERRMERLNRYRQYTETEPNDGSSDVDSSEDIINVSSTFGNVERNIFTKNFKGGSISCMFGGAQLNFSQADIQDTAIIDVSVMFGGGEIIIPSNWNVKNELSVILGGIEDRRTVNNNITASGKTLILRGNIMLGGFEIKSY